MNSQTELYSRNEFLEFASDLFAFKPLIACKLLAELADICLQLHTFWASQSRGILWTLAGNTQT